MIEGTKSFSGRWILGSSLVAASVSAWALPATLDIDFRSSEWSLADRNHTFTVGDVTATGLPGNSRLRVSADGLGVDSNILLEDPREIGPYEALTVVFGTEKALEGVWLTKLYDEWFDDSGVVELYHGSVLKGAYHFTGTANGELFVDFAGVIDATEARFHADHTSLLDLLFQRDYSVAGFDLVDPIPDPVPTRRVPESGSTAGMLVGGVLAFIALLGVGREQVR